MNCRTSRVLLLAFLLCVGTTLLSCAQPHAVSDPNVHPGANATFQSEDLDVARFEGLFESESREVYVHRAAIVAALGIEPGSAVADVGAGTGIFLSGLKAAVGPGGRVYAVDIAPKFIEYLARRVKEEGLERVEIITASEKSSQLPPDSIDLAFVCDTYHHFEYPQATLASLRSALRPGGHLVVVDFHRIEGKTREWLFDHMRAGQDVFIQEITSAGFELVEDVEVEGLVENYMLRFRSP